MDSVSSDSFSPNYEIEKLLEESAERTSGLSDDEKLAFYNAYAIVENNFVDLATFSDITGESDTAIIKSAANTQSIQTDQFECTRYVHNYLSSVYSWNEIIRSLVERHTDDVELTWNMFTSSHDEHPRSQYSRKIGYLRGLRTSCQHGDFSCLVFERYHEGNEEVHYRLRFDEHQFMTGEVGGAGLYLQHTRPQRRKYPIDFIDGFHHNEFQHFYQDMCDWFGFN
jgi:hypothetical protein